MAAGTSASRLEPDFRLVLDHDAPLYALAVRLDGLRPALLYLGPAVMAALVVIAGVFIARRLPRWCRLGRGVAVVALLAFCTPAMALFFVGRGFHVSTVLYALLAFAALRRGRFGPGWVLAVVLLVAGMLGDLLLVAYGAIPLLSQVSWRGCGSEGGKAPRAMSLLRSPVWGSPPSLVGSRTRGRVPVPAGALRSELASDLRESWSRTGLFLRSPRPHERPAP